MRRRGSLTKKNRIVGVPDDDSTFFDGGDETVGDGDDDNDRPVVPPSNGPAAAATASAPPPLPPDAKSVSDETKTSNVDKLFEDLLGTDASAASSEQAGGGGGVGGGGGGDDASTAMSSIVPLVTPGQIRAGAPRVTNDRALAGIAEFGGDDGLEGGGGGVVNGNGARGRRSKSGGGRDELYGGNQYIFDKNSSRPVAGDAGDDDGAGVAHGAAASSSVAGEDASVFSKPGEIFVYGGRGTGGGTGGPKAAGGGGGGPIGGGGGGAHHRNTHASRYRSGRTARQRNKQFRASGHHNHYAGAGSSTGSSSVGTTGVSNLLESMGIGNRDRHRRTDDKKDVDGKSKKSKSSMDEDSLLGGDSLSLDDESAEHRRDNYNHHRHGHNNRRSDGTVSSKFDKARRRRHHRMLHLRAGVVMVTLVGLMYASVQLTAVVKHERAALRHIRGSHGYASHYRAQAAGVPPAAMPSLHGEHEEGVDRPIRGELGVRMRARGDGTGRGRPSAVALKLVEGKVPKERGAGRDVAKYRLEGNGKLADPGGGGGEDDALLGEAGGGDPLGDDSPEEQDANPLPANEGEPAPLSAADVPADLLPPNVAGPAKDLMDLLQKNLPNFQYLSDIYTKDPSHDDVPLFFRIPRSGGGIVKDILGKCLGLALAGDAGEVMEHYGEKDLAVIPAGGQRYVNVDMATPAGIARAKSLNLATSGLADVVVTPRIIDAMSLFSREKKGRGLVVLRHPVHRAVSTYRHLKENDHPTVSKMSLEEYAKSPHAENNWMVRFLSGKMEGEVQTEDLAVAKEVLRTRFIVGLLEYKHASMARFDQYFGWNYDPFPSDQPKCRTRFLDGDPQTNELSKSMVKEDSQAWSLLLWQNKLDAKLYQYGQHLFGLQGQELFSNLDGAKAKSSPGGAS